MADVVLKDRNGTPVTYTGVSGVKLSDGAGGMHSFGGGGGGGIPLSVIEGTVTDLTQEDLAGLTAIRDYGFYLLTSLETIGFPDTVLSIGAYAFYGCVGLRTFSGDDGDKTNVLDYIGSIGAHAFEGCIGMNTALFLPEIRTIGEKAFADSSFALTLSIGGNCTSIGSKAFANTGFSDVYVEATTPPALTAADIFDGCETLDVIYVPGSALSAYQADRYWSAYASIMQGDLT